MRELEALERLASADSLRIGLISDTHIPEAMPRLWPQVFTAFRDVDCILHAGDIHDLSVIDQLSEVAPTYVARGNGDDGSGGRPVQPEDPRLREGWAAGAGRAARGHRAHDPRPRPRAGGRWSGRCSATAAARTWT